MLKKIKENFDEYNLKARVYPSLIALVPVFTFTYYFLQEVTGIGIIVSLTSSSLATIILLFFISDIIRNFGKAMELKIFNNELYFPTTEFLLHKNSHITPNKRIQIFNKMKNDF